MTYKKYWGKSRKCFVLIIPILLTIPPSWTCISSPHIVGISNRCDAAIMERRIRSTCQKLNILKSVKKISEIITKFKMGKPIPVVFDVPCSSPCIAIPTCPSCWILFSPVEVLPLYEHRSLHTQSFEHCNDKFQSNLYLKGSHMRETCQR